jgi:lipoate-protein ligase A
MGNTSMTDRNQKKTTSELPPAAWRLITSSPTPGPWNMAVDEAILEATSAGQVPPTLRLFAWEPACISLGYAQDFADVDHAKLNANGWDIVRRPTGGRAILHTDELTYSVTGPDREPRLAGDILTSYQRLSSAILAALQDLGLAVKAQPQDNFAQGQKEQPVCFEIPSSYEITIGGKKLVGSAQARKKGGVLQHGTLPLYGDLSRITQVLVFECEAQRARAAERLLERASTVESVLGHPVSWEAAAEAFTKAFSRTLNLTLEPGELTPGELARAEELEEIKYRNLDWLKNR